MLLSNKQVFKLLSPLLLVVAVLYFQEEIMGIVYRYMPLKKEKIHTIFRNQMQSYLFIERDIRPYNDVIKRNLIRKESIKWIIDKVVYNKLEKKGEEIIQKKVAKQPLKSWSVKAIFPDNNVAIINSKIAHIGSKIDGAIIEKIEEDRVLIKTAEGLKWIKLFH